MSDEKKGAVLPVTTATPNPTQPEATPTSETAEALPIFGDPDDRREMIAVPLGEHGGYDPATTEDLAAMLAALSEERRAAILLEFSTPWMAGLNIRAETAETALAEKEAELAHAHKDLDAWRDFWREHGEAITHCPGHHSQLVRDADGLLGHSPKPTEVSVELDRVKAELAAVKGERDRIVAAACLVSDNLNCIEHGTNYEHKGVKWCREQLQVALLAPPVPEVVGAKCPECKGAGGFVSTARGKGGQMSTECSACHGTGQSQPSPARNETDAERYTRHAWEHALEKPNVERNGTEAAEKKAGNDAAPDVAVRDQPPERIEAPGVPSATEPLPRQVTPPSAPAGRSSEEEGAPVLFGRTMVRQSLPGAPLFVLSFGGGYDDHASVYRDDDTGDGWLASAAVHNTEVGPFGSGDAQGAVTQLETRMRALAESFAFAAGSASSVDRERVREALAIVEGPLLSIAWCLRSPESEATWKKLHALLKGLCDAE